MSLTEYKFHKKRYVNLIEQYGGGCSKMHHMCYKDNPLYWHYNQEKNKCCMRDNCNECIQL